MRIAKKVFTLGTDRRSEEDFVEILLAYQIEGLVDVRSVPKSKITVFNRTNLEAILMREGIKYYFLGKELGGFRKGGYSAYTQSDEFMQGIEKLEQIAQDRVSVIVCAEHFPWKCHRKWISRELHQRGWGIEHIIDKGKVWVPK
jgi:uncharacterized protein (DUF488 family)